MLIRRVVGQSMAPTLKPGQLVIGRRPGKLRQGQIVIINHHGLEKIKRISRLEGNKLEIHGDNPAHSTDSRDFGWLPTDVVAAKVVWPHSWAKS